MTEASEPDIRLFFDTIENPVEFLTDVAKLLALSGWGQGNYAIEQHEPDLLYNFCIIGACTYVAAGKAGYQVTNLSGLSRIAYHPLFDKLFEPVIGAFDQFKDVVHFNDTGTYGEVVRLIHAAIEYWRAHDQSSISVIRRQPSPYLGAAVTTLITKETTPNV